MPKEVVIFIGPPGAGKGTQADLLQEEKGFFHLESSKVIEEKFASDPDDPVIRREKAGWLAGKLTSPELVREWMTERMRRAAAEGRSIVLSGSPRTLYEVEGEMPVLDELYGPQNIHIIHLQVPDERSIERNSKRRICKANRHPIPNLPGYQKLVACPKDGSELVTRALDTPETIRVRLQEYAERTAPVLTYLRDHGYTPIDIDGDAAIEAVHSHIIEALERRRMPVPQT